MSSKSNLFTICLSLSSLGFWLLYIHYLRHLWCAQYGSAILQTNCNVPAVLSEISRFPLILKYSDIGNLVRWAIFYVHVFTFTIFYKNSRSSFSEKMHWAWGWKFGKDPEIPDCTDWSAKTVQVVDRTLPQCRPQYRGWRYRLR